MSKAEIIEEISKLTPDEQSEILDVLWTFQGTLGPTDEEKEMLNRELADFEKNPNAGIPWEEFEKRMREK